MYKIHTREDYKLYEGNPSNTVLCVKLTWLTKQNSEVQTMLPSFHVGRK
jgi:hypothetical protein